MTSSHYGLAVVMNSLKAKCLARLQQIGRWSQAVCMDLAKYELKAVHMNRRPNHIIILKELMNKAKWFVMRKPSTGGIIAKSDCTTKNPKNVVQLVSALINIEAAYNLHFIDFHKR